MSDTSSSSSSIEYSSFSSFSSSSEQYSSSSSSLMNSSSSSSEEYSESSSSEGYSSESSSSSIDSSSSSSIDSSSSSSSIEIFNRAKPLILANSAISNSVIKNRLAQTVYFEETSLSIDKIYCYFFYPYGTNSSYQIKLDIYNCTDDGKPQTKLETSFINGSSINYEGWHYFEFNKSVNIPTNGYLSFVMWQDGGNEDNYTMWGYDYYESSSSEEYDMAWISNNESNWVKDEKVVRSLRIVRDIQIFDLVNYQVNTTSAQLKTIQQSFSSNSATFINTTVIDDKLVLNYPNLFISFLIDNSGSMGWNDRFANRQELVSNIITKLQSYSSEVLYDFITFGSKIANTTSVNSDIGNTMTINLDANGPLRSTYNFTLKTESNVAEGDVYSHNDNTYTILETKNNSTEIYCLGTGLPLNEGTLERTSGTGDESLVFSNYNYVSINNKISAYGLKNLKDKRNYYIGELKIDNEVIDSPRDMNWELYYPNTELPSKKLTNDGPNGSETIRIRSTNNVVARKVFSGNEIIYSYIVNDVNLDETTVQIQDASKFYTNQAIDLVNGDKSSTNHIITNINTSTNIITFTPGCRKTILSEDNFKGRVQISTNLFGKNFTGTTFQLLVKDVNADEDENITFFIQDINGNVAEWDFVAFNDWNTSNLFWLDETAILPISIFDTNDNPFPDGTEIRLEVDEKEILNSNTNSVSFILQDANIGDNRIYFEERQWNSNFKKDIIVNIIDKNNNIQTNTIESTGTNSIGYYINLIDELIYDFTNDNKSKVVINSKENKILGEDSLVSLDLPIVNITPKKTGKSLNPSLLKPYDIDQIPPSTTYESLNLSREYIQKGNADIPVIDGIASIRFLPITEDFLKTNKTKDTIASNLLRGNPKKLYSDQTIINDSDNISEITTEVLQGEDYTIETPVFLYKGRAESKMKTTSTDLTKTTFSQYRVPINDKDIIEENEANKLYVKAYEIFPSIIERDNVNFIKAAQYMDSFVVNFASPISIISDKSDQKVSFYSPNECEEGICYKFFGYDKVDRHGVYANDGNFVINYTVTDKGLLIKNGILKVKLYSNNIADQEDFSNEVDIYTDQNLTNVNNDNDITKWRKIVNNNPTSQILSANNRSIISGSNFISDRVSQLNQSIYITQDYPIDSESSYFYKDAIQWTNATQYNQYEYELQITNGKATLTIPESENVSVLMIEAVYEMNNGFETIRNDFIFIANPLTIGELNPVNITPIDETKTYEIGGIVTYYDEKYGTVENNTKVNFETSIVNLNPSISITDDGWAGGIFIGPKKPFEDDGACLLEEVCTEKQEKQIINVTITHSSGFENTVKRIISWKPSSLEETKVENNFYFNIDIDSWEIWSDNSDTSYVNIDLENELNPNIIYTIPALKRYLWIGQEGVESLQGANQPQNLPCSIKSTNINIFGSSKIWDKPQISFKISDINENIGNESNIGEYERQSYYQAQEPWSYLGSFLTSYLNESGKRVFGEGLINFPTPLVSGGWVYPKPIVLYKESLKIEIEIETYEGLFVRNGVQSANFVATITWNNQPIKNQFVLNKNKNDEITIDYPLPYVDFKIGQGSEFNSKATQGNFEDSPTTDYIDNRGDFGMPLKIDSITGVNLSSYSIQSKIERTDIYTIGEEGDVNYSSHTHACTVDNNGDGQTTSTIPLAGIIISDHTHQITKYNSDTQLGHSHETRCVAITELQPIVYQKDIYLNGYVEYDPTNCNPYAGTISEFVPKNKYGNRMMFSSYEIPGSTVVEKQLILELYTDNYKDSDAQYLGSSLGKFTYYASQNTTDTNKGFNITAYAYFDEYIDDSIPSSPVIVPKEEIDDGIRVNMEFSIYTQNNENDIYICGPDIIKNYMIIKVKASTFVDGYYAETEGEIILDSALLWLPDFRSLVDNPTNDTIYINSAISNEQYVGSSPLYDAMKLCSQRIINYQEQYSNVASYKKAIFLLTDGDENTSENSLNNSINSISFIESNENIPVIPIKLGKSYNLEEIILNKIATDTNTFMIKISDSTSLQISDIVNYIFNNSNFKINQGTYKNIIKTNTQTLTKKISLSNILTPNLTNVEIRYRTSNDSINWNNWSNWQKYTNDFDIDQNISNLTQYIEYEIKLIGDSDFNSPSLTENLKTDYYEPSEFVLFFTRNSLTEKDKYNDYGFEESNKFLSSIQITHEIDNIETTDIEYGITQSNSTDFNSFYKLFEPDQQYIQLTRYNEILITDDYKEYTAINGSWVDGSEISVYKINETFPNGILIDPKSYSIKNLEGKIIFNYNQGENDNFIIKINVSPYFRIACKVTNYGEKKAIIHHIGLIFNNMKRIPVDNNRITINKPINSRL